MNPAVWVFVAAGIALGAGIVELVTARKRPPPVRALHWVLLRVGVDAGVGAIAYPITSAAAGGADGPVVAVVAGLAGPAMLRVVIVVERPAGKTAAVGFERRYRQLMKAINERISQLGAASESAWINDVVLPATATITLDELSRRIETYFWALDMPPKAVQKELEHVKHVVDDAASTEQEKRRRLVRHLVESGNRVFLQRLLKVSRLTAVSVGSGRDGPAELD